jgi:hypothetical protein
MILVDPDNLELGQLVLIHVADRGGKVVLQSLWRVDRRGRVVTRIEDVAGETSLLKRLAEFVPLFCRGQTRQFEPDRARHSLPSP